MDDFGTGHSSLAYLQRFPIDVLKIDRSFIDGLGRPGPARSLVEGVLSLARSMGLRTVAEGVEHGEQAAQLRDLDCGLAQGFHLGVPMDATSFEAALLGSAHDQSEPGT